MEMRVLRLLTVTAVALFLAMVVLFAYGTPQAPEAVAAQSVPAPLEPGADAPGFAGEAVAAEPATTEQPASAGAEMSGMGAADPDATPPEADPSSPLAIEIPGCVCHSDDPKEVERHSGYRMNQCAGCHMGDTAAE